MAKLLIRYGEIALKSNWVRRKFQNRLVTNIQDYFLHRGVECMMRSEYGRIYLDTDEVRQASEILSRIFGVTSFSIAEMTSSDMEDVARLVMERFRSELKPGRKFAVRVRRTGEHKYTSQELASYVGSAVQSRLEKLQVDLDKPDVEIFIEVRGKVAYVFSGRIAAPGGMPLGTQGTVLAVVDSSKGLAGAWLMMKRGCKVHVSHFGGSGIIDPLRNWDIHLKAYPLDSWSDLDSLIDRTRPQGFVTAWEDQDKFTPARKIPVFYPAIGLGKEELDQLLKKIRK